MNILIMDMQTLFPYPCNMLFWIYAYHVTWNNLYMSQIGDWKFHQIFYFAHYKFDLLFFKLLSLYDNNDE